MILDLSIWTLFDTTFSNDYDVLVAGKLIISCCIFAGVIYNIYLLISILNIMNIKFASRTKFSELMNQLDAYMKKKQFSIILQAKLRFFYKRKFRSTVYREDEILKTLSG